MSKSENAATVWVDLTDMLVWSGHFTGIQRVVFEYAKRFEKDGANFFAYDKADDRFIRLELNQLDLGQTDSPHKKASLAQPTKLRRRIRRTLGKPYYMLGAKQKAALRPLVDAANYYVRSVMSRLDKRSHSHVSAYSTYQNAHFKGSDTVILLGASWNDGVVLDRLIVIKQETGLRLVQHINDLLPIYQPQLFSEELPRKFRRYINNVIHHASVITVISEATRRDVLAYCEENHVQNVPVKVVRLGEDVDVDKPLRPERVPANKRFILAVGTFEVRKNYILLYQVVKLAQLENKNLPHIVIAGRKGWLTDDLAHILELDPQAREHITWLDDASDNELSWLYENCIFTVFPSLAEGWGLPIVESLQHGKMSIASGVSSMLEIGNGLVDYFLPYDARECMEKIRYYATEERYSPRNDNVKKAYKAFSWDESYQDIRSSIG